MSGIHSNSEVVSDLPHFGRPIMSTTKENITQRKKMVLKN